MAERMKGGRGLALLALLVSIAALVIAVMAYQRTGADLKLRERVESLQQALDNARRETANALSRLEELVRGSEEKRR
jgi:cell division protein ZapA (FtsZ GTPase activity inhibitor)